MTLLRVQKTAQVPQVQFTEKLVEVTVTMRTSSSSQGTTANSRDVTDSGSSNSSEWWTLQLCSRQRHWQVPSIRENPEGCRKVQFWEMNQQYRNGCRTSRRSRRLLRSHTLRYRDRCRTSRKLTRHRRRSSFRGDARQTVVQSQCPTSRRFRLGCSSAVQYENDVVHMPVEEGRRARFRRAADIEAHTGTVHRQDRWCSREGEAPGYNSSSARHDRCSRFRRAEGRPVELSQVQHTERIIDVRAVIQHQTPAIRTVQETVKAPQRQQH